MFRRVFLATTLLRLSLAVWTEPAQVLRSVTCAECSLALEPESALNISIPAQRNGVYDVRIDKREEC